MGNRDAAFLSDSGRFSSSMNGQYSMSALAVRELAQEVILRVASQAKAERVEATVPKIALLAKALVASDDEAAVDFVRDERMRGMPADTLYHGLVAGAVDEVGKTWDRGEISVPDVLAASRRVWRILCDLREVFVQICDRIPGRHTVFLQCPGETHSLGMTMAADDLRRRGWEVETLVGYDQESLINKMERLCPSTVAIAASHTDMTLPIARLVVSLRAHLPGVWVLIGGQITEAEPGIAMLTGADAMANSADEAERLILAHLNERAERRVNRA